MDHWPYPVQSLSAVDIQIHCVRNELWQGYRLSMKDRSTRRKLQLLESWYLGNSYNASRVPQFARQIQCSNYINALKRGGQLDSLCRIRDRDKTRTIAYG